GLVARRGLPVDRSRRIRPFLILSRGSKRQMSQLLGIENTHHRQDALPVRIEGGHRKYMTIEEAYRSRTAVHGRKADVKSARKFTEDANLHTSNSISPQNWPQTGPRFSTSVTD